MAIPDCYRVLYWHGFNEKSQAYDYILKHDDYFGSLKGVTTYYDQGKWFIVQSKTIAGY